MGRDLKGKELGTGLLQLKNGMYCARFRSRSGKRPEKKFKKLQEAKKWLAEQKYLDEHGTIFCTDITVNAWFDYWMNNIKKPVLRYRTVINYTSLYNNVIKAHIGRMLLKDVKPVHISCIINQDYSRNYLKGAKALATSFFSCAVENGLIEKSPVTRSIKLASKTKQERRVMTVEEQRLFENYIKKRIYQDHYMFLLQTGLRIGEMQALKWEDVDWDNRFVHVGRTMIDVGKNITNEPKTLCGNRNVPLTGVALEILQGLKRTRKDRPIVMPYQDYIFIGKEGRPVERSAYNQSLKRICKQIGIERISCHVLRHTFATRCIEAGMRPKTLQKILGHSDVGMTMNLYVHVTDETQHIELRKFEKLAQGGC